MSGEVHELDEGAVGYEPPVLTDVGRIAEVTKGQHSLVELRR